MRPLGGNPLIEEQRTSGGLSSWAPLNHCTEAKNKAHMALEVGTKPCFIRLHGHHWLLS